MCLRVVGMHNDIVVVFVGICVKIQLVLSKPEVNVNVF